MGGEKGWGSGEYMASLSTTMAGTRHFVLQANHMPAASDSDINTVRSAQGLGVPLQILQFI